MSHMALAEGRKTVLEANFDAERKAALPRAQETRDEYTRARASCIPPKLDTIAARSGPGGAPTRAQPLSDSCAAATEYAPVGAPRSASAERRIVERMAELEAGFEAKRQQGASESKRKAPLVWQWECELP